MKTIIRGTVTMKGQPEEFQWKERRAVKEN